MVTTRSQSKRSADPEESSRARRSKRAKASRRSQGRKNVKTETEDPANHKEPHVVIDHLGFAHIIDAILDYGGPEVWRTFRATCKLYHARIPGPANRIVMNRKGGDAFAAVGRPGRSAVGIDDYLDASSNVTSSLGNLPLTLTRTLDIRRGVSRPSQLPWADDLAYVELVRATADGRPVIPAPVYVLICYMYAIPYNSANALRTASINVTRALNKLVVATHFSRLSSTTRNLEFHFREFPGRLVLHCVLDRESHTHDSIFDMDPDHGEQVCNHNWSTVKRMITNLVQQICYSATSRGTVSESSRIPSVELVDIHKFVDAWAWASAEASITNTETRIREIWNDAITIWGRERQELVPELKFVLNRKLRISTAATYAFRERIEEKNLWLERGLHFGQKWCDEWWRWV